MAASISPLDPAARAAPRNLGPARISPQKQVSYRKPGAAVAAGRQRGRMAVRLICALIAAASLFGTAVAQTVTPAKLRADPFSALVGKRQSAAERAAAQARVDRFVVATDDRVFLFQPGERDGRVKFLCGDRDLRVSCIIDKKNPAEEIFLISASRVSRGDVEWRNGEGQTMLRVSAYGGVTVFWPGETRGHAASKSFGEDPALILEIAGLETARARAQAATALVSAKVGAPIIFDVGDPGPDRRGGASVLADAVVRAADGISRVADDPTGARVLASRIRQVQFRPMPAPSLGFEEEALVVGYDPTGDVDGRPSSAKIAKFLEESL